RRELDTGGDAHALAHRRKHMVAAAVMDRTAQRRPLPRREMQMIAALDRKRQPIAEGAGEAMRPAAGREHRLARQDLAAREPRLPELARGTECLDAHLLDAPSLVEEELAIGVEE